MSLTAEQLARFEDKVIPEPLFMNSPGLCGSTSGS
jgi:hypothetical protein